MSKRSPQLLLEDIVESANKILLYTAGLSFEQFLADGKTVDAVVRNFEIIGMKTINPYIGATSNLPPPS